MMQPDMSKLKTRNIALLFVEPAGFAALFKKGMKFRASAKVVKGLPADTVVEYVFASAERAGVMIMVRSAEFAPVPQGHMPPILQVEIEVK
jgi:hypothetical protein